VSEARGALPPGNREKSGIKGKYKTFSGKTLKSIDDLFISSMSAPRAHQAFSLVPSFPYVISLPGRGLVFLK
jgi:hypothetical protein